jgi:pimeloyl-ACP methyl ester carboxylesterase
MSDSYDTVLRRWRIPVEPVVVPSEYGTTTVQVCGPEDGPPLVLLHGFGSTATVWYANAADLAGTHRLFAVDHGGRSVFDGKPFATVDDLMTWLGGLLAGLGLDHAALCGHSYGAWLALSYALRSPRQVDRLALLDPTDCFAGLRLTYRLRAIPLLAAPNARRLESFLRWETGGAELDPAWLATSAAERGRPGKPRLVLPKRPAQARFTGFAVPTLVLIAGRSRAHDVGLVEANARRLLPGATVTVLPDATHHSIPMCDAGPLDRALLDFLDRT